MSNKYYLSVGIGDFICLDSLLPPQIKADISEIYWGCRFGYVIKDLLQNNSHYPNLKTHHLISDEAGKAEMAKFEPHSVNFWHFRPDFGKFPIAMKLFNYEGNDVKPIDTAGIFQHPDISFTETSFKEECNMTRVNFLEPGNFILVHMPTSSRPRSDIATITEQDKKLIISIAEKYTKQLVILTDHKLTDFYHPLMIEALNLPIREVPWLVKNCFYFMGCDSFASILASRLLPPEKISIKSHNPNLSSYIDSVWGRKYFMPHTPSVIKTFYKNELENKL